MRYQTREILCGKGKPTEVQLTLFLTGPDWCRLRDSSAWHRLEAYIDRIEKEHSRSRPQVPKFQSAFAKNALVLQILRDWAKQNEGQNGKDSA